MIEIKLIGKLYNLFNIKEFSETKDHISLIFSISRFIKKEKIIFLSKINIIIINNNVEISLVRKTFIDKENISFEANEVT